MRNRPIGQTDFDVIDEVALLAIVHIPRVGIDK